MRMIILAAGQGTRLRPLTDHCPKCMVELAGKPLLDWQIETARSAGCDEVIVVGGYRAEQLKRSGVKLVVNELFESTNMVHSLFCAEEFFGDEFVISYGDIVYEQEVFEAVAQDDAPISIAVDTGWQAYWESRFDDPLADAESLQIGSDGQITSIGQMVTDISEIEGQYIGLMAFRAEGVRQLRDAYTSAEQSESNPFGCPRPLAGLYMTDLLQGMVDRGDGLKPVSIDRGWYEIDSLSDLKVAESEWPSSLRKAG